MTSPVAETIVRIAARLVPREVRADRLEEWLADLDHGADIGISSADVAAGAVISAVLHDVRGSATHHPPNGVTVMTENLKSSIRLALYAVWITLSAVFVWIAATQFAGTLATGSGPGFSFGVDGPHLDLALPMLVAGVLSLALASALAVRSAVLAHRVGPTGESAA